MTGKSKKEKEHSKSIDKFTIVNEELYKVLCETIQNLLQNSIMEEGISEQEIERCLLRQLLLLSRNPRKLLYSDPSSQKHEKPPKNYLQCREDIPKAELFFDQPSLHCRCPYFLPEF